MDSLSTLFHRKLEALISEERQNKLESLTQRLAHDEYLYRIGYITAMNHVLDWCDTTRKEINEAT